MKSEDTESDEEYYLRALTAAYWLGPEECRNAGEPEINKQFLECYANLLEKKKDPRGDFLRLHLMLSDPGWDPKPTDADRTRYRELLSTLSPLLGIRNAAVTWIALVSRTARLLNCGSGATHSPRVRFSFECPNQWETLAPTEASNIRFCAECSKTVYLCDSAETANRHALAGHCISVPREVSDPLFLELTRNVTGYPELGEVWAEELFPEG